ncbi:MAG: alpha-galactosidase [Nitrospirae bacterium]|nr:alpha-galactosidase [Nitrospirota bacterium]
MSYSNYLKRFSITAEIDGVEITFPDLELKTGNYSCGDFRLQIKAGTVLDLNLQKEDNSEFEIQSLKYSFCANLKNFSKLIVPDCGRYYHRYFIPLLSWGKSRVMVNGNHGTPFVAFLNHFNEVNLAVGIIGEPIETSFTISSPGRTSKNTLAVFDGRLIFDFERPINGFRMGKTTALQESLYITESSKTWFHALREYGQEYYNLHPPEFEIRENAFNPTWCSWVPWNSDDLTADLILRQAEQCKELGIKSLMIDDGWFGPGCDSEITASSLGDYDPDPRKFPDMKGLVKKIKELGIEPIIWTAPLAVSPDAKIKKDVEHLLMKTDEGLWIGPNMFHNLCPSSPEARAIILKTTRKLLDLGFDGIKADLYNNISATPCRGEHAHDCPTVTRGIMRLMKELWEDMKSYRPSALMEIKVNYGNMRSAQYGSMVRGGDSPYDNINNFYNLAYMRAFVPIVHNDYLSWTIAEEDRDLAILIMKMITLGVPTFSVDLKTLPEGHRRILKRWLKFYTRHLPIFKTGIYEPQTGELFAWQIENETEALYSLLNESREIEIKLKKHLTIMNGTKYDEIYIRTGKEAKYNLKTFNYYLDLTDEREITLKDKTSLPIPSAGIVELEKTP